MGYIQTSGIDYLDLWTNSKNDYYRNFGIFGCMFMMGFAVINIKNVFLYRDLEEEEVFMDPPPSLMRLPQVEYVG